MKITDLMALLLVAVAAQARAELPQLVELDLLPAVTEAPACACVVRGIEPEGGGDGSGESDFLIVGYAGGYLMGFQRVAGRSARPLPMEIPGRAPVTAVAGVGFPGGAGPGTNHAILAVAGRTVFALSLERGAVMGTGGLPQPVGAYRLVDLGAGHAAAYDDVSMWSLVLEGTTTGWSVRAEKVLSAAEGLRVTEFPTGSLLVLAAGRLHAVTSGGVRALGEVPLGGSNLMPPVVCTERLVAGRDSADPGTLRLLARSQGGPWAAGAVLLPGPLTMLMAISDSTVLAGGATDVETGWVETIDARGTVLATGAHAVPPAHACAMDGCFVVHGEYGNLTVFGPSLESLWDQSSRFIAPVALLELDYDGDGYGDAALVGGQTVASWKAETDSLRRFLRSPDIMRGARLVMRGSRERYERDETYAEVLLSRRAALVAATKDLERRGIEMLRDGDDAAIRTLCESRAAAAAVGDREGVVRLTRTLGDWTTRGRRTLATAVVAAVLALAGALYSAVCVRRMLDIRATVALAAALLAIGVLGWQFFGSLPWTPLLAVGGLTPLGAAAWRIVSPRAGVRPHPQAPIDELREAMAGFVHAVDDGLRSVGRAVGDAPRKTVTALAGLAEDVRASSDDPDQCRALLERVRVRAESFRRIVLPQLDHILWLAGRARFLVPEATAMRAAGARIAAALGVLLADDRLDDSPPVAELRAIPEARLELVAAAERAWESLRANPGCSLTVVFEYVAGEKKDEMARNGVSLRRDFDIKPGSDAVRIAPHELYGIIENLFANALRATADARARVISVGARSQGDACHVRFSDTGDGMSQDQVAGLFSQARGDVREGKTGLPQARRILRRYGGDIGVEKTEIGGGTTFLLIIPHWGPTESE